MAPSKRKRTREAEDIIKLGTRLMKQQREFCRGGSRTGGDYDLIEKLDYTLAPQAEQQFLPYGLNGMPFTVAAKRLTANEKEYFRLLTGYGIAQYIREQLICQACLDDLTLRKEEACSEIDGKLVANDSEHDEILAHKYLNGAFPKHNVCEVFLEAMSIHLVIMKFHMVDPIIGKSIQATVVKQPAFFKKTGSCPNGRSHRTNLLGFMIHLLLSGENWVQETVTNVPSFKEMKIKAILYKYIFNLLIFLLFQNTKGPPYEQVQGLYALFVQQSKD
ncbi:uncharacterized protein ACN427_002478 isoform 1-T2 [Glossina fuscipes fuscipes]